jgi:hypothetical protein
MLSLEMELHLHLIRLGQSDYLRPTAVKEIRSFIGLASFYRRLVPKFAEIAKPLTELIRKDEKFQWGDRQQEPFDSLEEK